MARGQASRSRSRRGRDETRRGGVSANARADRDAPNRSGGLLSGRRTSNADSPAPGERTGTQKAKEAIEKEREKARLKKLERERLQNEKVQARQESQEQKRADDQRRLDLALAEVADLSAGIIGAVATSEARLVALATATELPPVAAPERPPPAVAVTEPPATRSRTKMIFGHEAASLPPVDVPQARKLFDFLDRSGKALVSHRDVLVSLKKHPQVRCLFGLPVNGSIVGAASLETRMMAIQDAFEGGSGLGELNGVFTELSEDSGGGGQTFTWEAFLASCQRGGLRASVASAVALLPREHATGTPFLPTSTWQVVPEGAACPGGLEYKMDMETGRTMARWPAGKS